MNKLPLWMIGFLLIVGVAVSHALKGTPQNRSEALGQGLANLLLVIIGVAFIIAHFIRRKK